MTVNETTDEGDKTEVIDFISRDIEFATEEKPLEETEADVDSEENTFEETKEGLDPEEIIFQDIETEEDTKENTIEETKEELDAIGKIFQDIETEEDTKENTIEESEEKTSKEREVERWIRQPVAMGYVTYQGVGTFKLHAESRHWNRAKEVCESEKAHLVVVDTQYKVDVLLDLFSRQPHIPAQAILRNQVYVGMSDQVLEGVFYTVFVLLNINIDYLTSVKNPSNRGTSLSGPLESLTSSIRGKTASHSIYQARSETFLVSTAYLSSVSWTCGVSEEGKKIT
uniref:C-type lectin domain-containing protein n=1 Tax=Timema cristinae TaxID=61476 RepID=A0A7R9CHD8_TIMCR|nr:unnamed protein product [Timema cristinae]